MVHTLIPHNSVAQGLQSLVQIACGKADPRSSRRGIHEGNGRRQSSIELPPAEAGLVLSEDSRLVPVRAKAPWRGTVSNDNERPGSNGAPVSLLGSLAARASFVVRPLEPPCTTAPASQCDEHKTKG